ncbi:MAG: hypothetical protein RI967_613 [Planctomycetota bacterium]
MEPTMPRHRRLLAIASLAFLATLPAAARQDDEVAAPPTPPASTKEAAKDAAKKDFPTVESILAKSAEAVGGRDAWSKVKSIRTKGTFSVPASGIAGPVVAEMAQPNRMRQTMNLAGIGEVMTGFDGTTAWATDRIQGPRLMTGDELEAVRRESEMMKDFDVKARYDALEVVAEADHGGFACWELLGTKGDEKTTLWFEKETGLARGSRMTVKSSLGEIPVESVVKEYRPFEGEFGRVLMPVSIEMTQMGQKLATTIESAEFNVVEDAAFELPVAIKALLEPEPADEDEDGDEDGDEDEDMDDDTDDAAKPAPAPTAPTAPKTPASPAPKR